MNRIFVLAATTLLALSTTQSDATLMISYDSLNRPTSVSELPVPVAPFLVNISIDYSGLSFDSQYDPGQPPMGSPGGLTFGNGVLAGAVADALRDAMNADAEPLPVLFYEIFFPWNTTSTEVGFTEIFNSSGPGTPAWEVVTQSNFRAQGFSNSGWATVSAVPEPSAFLCVGLIGWGVAEWKRRTANRDH